MAGAVRLEQARGRAVSSIRNRGKGPLLASVVAVAAAVALLLGTAVPAGARRVAQPIPRTCTAALCAAWTLPLGKVWVTSPTFATIDGVRAVVAASIEGRVYVVNAATHVPLPGWADGKPAVMESGQAPSAIDSSPAVAYLDGPDKPPSIIVGTGSLWAKNQNGGLIAWNANGSVRFIVHTHNSFNEWGSPGGGNYDNSVFSTPAVGDFLGNGQLQIAFGSYDHMIYMVTAAGTAVPGFPIARADTIWSSPAMADTSRTGRDDLIIGGDASGLDKCDGGWITDYRWTGSAPTLEWSHCIGETIWSSPTVGVINSSGRPAVVVGTSWDYQNPAYLRTAAAHEVFAWYADNGATVPGWPVNAGSTCNDPSKYPAGGTFGSPAIGQITPSGGPVVISTSHTECLAGPAVVSEWTGAGKLVWSQTINDQTETVASPAVVDMGNGMNDVLVGSGGALVVLNGETGAFMDNTQTSPIQAGCNVSSAPAVSPVPGFAPSGWALALTCGQPVGTAGATLAVFGLPSAPALPPMWPEWRADQDRNGVPDPLTIPGAACTKPKTPAGYRFMTEDGQVIADFNLPGCGDVSSRVLPGPVAGETSTPDGGGYWIVLQDGAVYPFGDAKWYGDARMGNYATGAGLAPPGVPMTGIASTPDGKGYYLTDAHGDVYAFGDAAYHGSESGKSTNGAIAGIVADDATGGYWLYTTKGSVYPFGAPFHGSAATRKLTSAVVGMAALPSGSGYWLATQVGWVFGYGVKSEGSIATIKHEPVIGLVTAQGGKGYYIGASDGGVFREPGNIAWYGSGVGKAHSEPIVSFAGIG